jgi:hypothetical protein
VYYYFVVDQFLSAIKVKSVLKVRLKFITVGNVTKGEVCSGCSDAPLEQKIPGVGHKAINLFGRINDFLC